MLEAYFVSVRWLWGFGMQAGQQKYHDWKLGAVSCTLHPLGSPEGLGIEFNLSPMANGLIQYVYVMKPS